MHQTDCLFCQIAQGSVPCHEVWSSPTHLAFLSIFPNTEGVTVVIPREHYGSYLFDQSEAVVSAQILASQQAAAVLDQYFADVGRCGVVFEGFGVDHLHTKLFPLHGTADMKEWQKIESQTNKDFYDRYPGFISSHDSHRVEDQKLAELAAKIRKSASS
jgi:diadenosine tetraphosphate (Ap4A) HIT family hydrolase